MKTLTILEVEYIAHRLAQALLSWDEPIPKFDTRYPNILESCLIVPFQTFDRKPLYKGLINKAAILFYLMVKNHPFKNGNKRIAMTTMLVFLYKNNKWITVNNFQMYKFAKWVAESDPLLKDATIAAIQKFLQTYLMPLKKLDLIRKQYDIT